MDPSSRRLLLGACAVGLAAVTMPQGGGWRTMDNGQGGGCCIDPILTVGCRNFGPCRPTPVVRTTNGPITGYVQKDGIENYLGVRFAADTGGTNRWRAPQAPAPWTGVKRCNVWPRTCPQNPANWGVKPWPAPWNATKAPEIGLTSSEDCLFLNVVRPPPSEHRGPRPVMVWLFGGGFVAGDSWNHGQFDSGTNSSTLVREQGVIVVTVNYRLNILGFMAHPQLFNESGTQGNYGMLDQVAGLRWVHENIEAFGGDKGRVTIFGESAGGISVCWHLAAPISRGLFSSAIMQSGFCDYRGLIQTPELMYEFYQQRGRHMGCGNATEAGAEGAAYLECMRTLDWRNIIMNNPNLTFPVPAPCFTIESEATCKRQAGGRCTWTPPGGAAERGHCRGNHPPPPPPAPKPPAPPKPADGPPVLQDFPLSYPPMKGFLAIGPVIDGTVLPALPQELIEAGRWNKVPLVIGNNHDEGNFFVLNVKAIVPGVSLPLSANQTITVLNHFIGENLTNLIPSVYPEPTPPPQHYQPQQDTTDLFAREQAGHGNSSTGHGGNSSGRQAREASGQSGFRWDTGRMSTILTDYFFRCRTRRTARALVQQGVPVYAYEFSYPLEHWFDGILLQD